MTHTLRAYSISQAVQSFGSTANTQNLVAAIRQLHQCGNRKFILSEIDYPHLLTT